MGCAVLSFAFMFLCVETQLGNAHSIISLLEGQGYPGWSLGYSCLHSCLSQDHLSNESPSEGITGCACTSEVSPTLFPPPLAQPRLPSAWTSGNPGLPRCRWILHQLSHVSHAYYLVEDTGGGRGGCRPEDLGGPAPRICGASKSPSPGRRRPLGGQLYWTGPALGRGWDSGDSPQAGSGGGAWRGTSLGRGTCLTAATAARDHVRMASVWTSVVMEAVTPDP